MRALKEPNDSNFGLKKGGEDSEKKVKASCRTSKSKQTLVGLKGSEFLKILTTGELDGIL